VIIEKPSFPSPVIIIDDFLSSDAAAECLAEFIRLEPVYAPAMVGTGADAKQADEHRQNEVVYLDDVFRTAPARSKILSAIKGRIWDDECLELWSAGRSLLEAINYATRHEAVGSRYGTGQFYAAHQDTKRNPGNQDIQHRIVTLVYYVHREPAAFTGGALTLIEAGERVTVQPKHNRAVIFPSITFHEVEPVSMESEKFEDGRFSLNYWMGFT
jgi:hypothetical protein